MSPTTKPPQSAAQFHYVTSPGNLNNSTNLTPNRSKLKLQMHLNILYEILLNLNFSCISCHSNGYNIRNPDFKAVSRSNSRGCGPNPSRPPGGRVAQSC